MSGPSATSMSTCPWARMSGSGRRRRGARRAHRGRRPARARRRGESASRSAGRPRPGVGRVPTTRSTPRSSSSSTPLLTVVRASPAACTRSALLTAVPEATSRASVLSVTGTVEAGREGGRAQPQRREAATDPRFRPLNDTRRHYSVVVRHWSTLLGCSHVPARRGGGMADTERPARSWRAGRRTPAAADARHRQGVPRRPCARRGRPRRRRGRGALPAGPERRRQVDADQGARRGATARTRARSAGRASRSSSARRTTRTPPASPPSTRSSTSSPGSRWRRTSSSATSPAGSGSAGRGRRRTRPGPCCAGWATPRSRRAASWAGCRRRASRS